MRATVPLKNAPPCWRLGRASVIGVIYRPVSELHSHYLEASLPAQYDAFVWFDETLPITPLQPEQGTGSADTFPSGL